MNLTRYPATFLRQIFVNDSRTGASNTIKLDFDDHKSVANVMARLPLVLWRLDLHPDSCYYSYSPSGRGMHVVITVDEMLPPKTIVFLQAILGSDYRREIFNYIRARGLGAAPRCWRNGRWNVLYSQRLRAGK